MPRLSFVVWLVGVCGCTKANPAATCINGACLDPDFPFCDVTGDVGGVPNACTENPDCVPSTVTCDGATVTTCDSSGTVSNVEQCALGCEDKFAACKVFVPANDIQQFIDMADPPVDLQLDQGTFFADDGTFHKENGDIIDLHSIDVPAPPGGTPFRVVVGKHIMLGSFNMRLKPGQPLVGDGQGRALVLYATDGIEVVGRIEVDTGALAVTGCTGGQGFQQAQTGGTWTSGGGGGGHATAGGRGGEVQNGGAKIDGGPPGMASGSEELVPLRGGCPAGQIGVGIVAAGGGSIQLSSLTTITVSGSIVADGGFGSFGIGPGGGGGGGILLDAPTVTIDTTAKLLARGGPGRAGIRGAGITYVEDEHVIAGEKCQNMTGACGAGGDGGADGIDPENGDLVNATDTTSFSAGGGGGGVGRIRINTATGDAGIPVGAVLAGAFTQGTIGTK